MVTQSMYNLGFLVYYQFNKAQITEEFCVNKNKPEMCCEGQCYVSKRLEHQEQKQQNICESADLPLFIVEQGLSPVVGNEFSINLNFLETTFQLGKYNSKCLKPPIA